MSPHVFEARLGLRLGVLALALALLLPALPGCGSAGKSSQGKAPPGRSRPERAPPARALPAKATRRHSSLPWAPACYGPPGLRATVYAQGPPTLAAFAFDLAGRLWLTAAGLETHTQDGVYVIAKASAPAQKVIAGLDDPLGLHWYRGKLYVASVGRVDA